MEIKVESTSIKIEFSFLILVAFAVLYGYENSIRLIAYSLLHEAGHLIALIIVGIKPRQINFSFYGIGMKYSDSISNVHELLVLICGPLANLVLYLIFKDNLNLILFILNIYPAFPLDGGRILKIIFPSLSRILNFIFVFILILASIYLMYSYKSYSLFFISIYLLIFNFSNYINRGFYEKMC